MKSILTFLGCGSSMGVPIIGCECSVCISKNKKNKRLRSSIVIDLPRERILIDSGPDLRQQMLLNSLSYFDSVFYTHAHSDHFIGMDEMRSVYNKRQTINIYSTNTVIQEISKTFSYMMQNEEEENRFPKIFKKNIIQQYQHYRLHNNTNFIAYDQIHGKSKSIGYKFGKMAYSTDLSYMPQESIEVLKNKVDTLILGCNNIKEQESSNHAHMELCIHWIETIKPKLAILTHMSHSIEYDKTMRALEKYPNIILAFDGMRIEIDI